MKKFTKRAPLSVCLLSIALVQPALSEKLDLKALTSSDDTIVLEDHYLNAPVKIRALIIDLKRDLREERLAVPSEDQTAQKLEKIRSLGPDPEILQRLYHEVGDAYLVLANRSIENQAFSIASLHMAKARRYNPDSPNNGLVWLKLKKASELVKDLFNEEHHKQPEIGQNSSKAQNEDNALKWPLNQKPLAQTVSSQPKQEGALESENRNKSPQKERPGEKPPVSLSSSIEVSKGVTIDLEEIERLSSDKSATDTKSSVSENRSNNNINDQAQTIIKAPLSEPQVVNVVSTSTDHSDHVLENNDDKEHSLIAMLDSPERTQDIVDELELEAPPKPKPELLKSYNFRRNILTEGLVARDPEFLKMCDDVVKRGAFVVIRSPSQKEYRSLLVKLTVCAKKIDRYFHVAHMHESISGEELEIHLYEDRI